MLESGGGISQKVKDLNNDYGQPYYVTNPFNLFTGEMQTIKHHWISGGIDAGEAILGRIGIIENLEASEADGSAQNNGGNILDYGTYGGLVNGLVSLSYNVIKLDMLDRIHSTNGWALAAKEGMKTPLPKGSTNIKILGRYRNVSNGLVNNGLRVTRTLGVLGGVVSVASSTVNIVDDVSNGREVNNWDVADLGVGGLGIAAAVMSTNPVGWAFIGVGVSVYFVGRIFVGD